LTQALNKKYGEVPKGWEEMAESAVARKQSRKQSRKASRQSRKNTQTDPPRLPPTRLMRSSSTSAIQDAAEASGDTQKFAMLAGMSSFAKKGGTNRILKGKAGLTPKASKKRAASLADDPQ
jgi:hypothetical protein